jgi:hypothetical protein
LIFSLAAVSAFSCASATRPFCLKVLLISAMVAKGEGYVGKRLSLTVIGEETDPEKIKAVRHRNIPSISEEEGKYLVHFHIEGVRSLIGNE